MASNAAGQPIVPDSLRRTWLIGCGRIGYWLKIGGKSTGVIGVACGQCPGPGVCRLANQ